MTQIHPFAGAVAQTPQAARLAQVDRDQQIRKTLEKQRATGLTDQHPDEYVQNADSVQPVGNETSDRQKSNPRKKPPSKFDPDSPEDPPRLDVRA
ncbi:MAG: hypothetical protein KatS3mg104_1832 [Phycisphaerae bacterium]|mgnify:CR=1 FL=1|jgi:hypothetical protein|nr:MAG: hypothetical protein KatS3mg104_1832 [Phycisphaerae bacterium]